MERQLEDDARGNPPLPFETFLRALRTILHLRPDLERATLLDVGCGVGHYGVLLKRHYPTMNYVGVDASAAMIDAAVEFHKAREGNGILVMNSVFSVCAFDAAPFDAFRLILAAQVMEYTSDPMATLELMLKKMRAGSILILHRLRWGNHAQRVYEKTYCDYDTQNFIWDGAEVTRRVLAHGDILRFEKWEQSATMVVEKKG